jgi:IS605 OrfB family transposase
MLRVKLIAQVKLLPSNSQSQALKATLELANAACDWISELAWDAQVFRQYDLHKLIYHRARGHYDLSAQVIVRCIAKVADAYKLDKKTARTFKPHGAIAFDDRILSWKTDKQVVSIWTLNGRQKIPYICGERQKRLLESRIGETDLVYRKGRFYLLAVCEVPEPTPADVDDVLGVDFGVVNLATTSDGEVFSGSDVERVRQRYHARRRTLQRAAEKAKQRGKRPKQIRRALKRTKGKESNFRSHTNHVISKQLVRTAKDTSRGIAIEELKGVRERTRFRKSQRARMSGWSFYQLRQFLEYKARLNGIRLITVDPRNTLRRCHECGHCDKANRRTQENFECQSCGHRSLADFNAALNIRERARASVNALKVSEHAASVAA